MVRIIVVVLMLLLTSCAHMKRKDGPPNFYVDETKISNAVPKDEPLSKYGNMRSYRVFGKRYYTLKSSRNYNQVGIASWYGTQFHEHNTSSGEPYDMLAMTAAHKSLPLPTYVEVTNLRNNRKIIVKVNDRGPFAPNRIIDLSYVAAKKLGMLGHGTTRVRVKAINPRTYYNNIDDEPTIADRCIKSKQPRSVGQVYVHVGTFKHKPNAMKLKRQLASRVKAPINVSRLRSGMYRVQIGPLKDRYSADKVHSRLVSLGIKS